MCTAAGLIFGFTQSMRTYYGGLGVVLGGVGAAMGSSAAPVARQYGPLQMADGQTLRLNAANLYGQSQPEAAR